MTAKKELSLDAEITLVANLTARRFHPHTTPADIRQELWAYSLAGGKRHVDKAVEDGDDYRLKKLLFGVARRYAEQEKAAGSGYHFADVAWYSPEKLADLIPLALDAGWDGLTGAGEDDGSKTKTDGREGGSLLAMIVDVRIALRGSDGASLLDFDPETVEGWDRLVGLSERLGGEFPDSPGYGRGRRAVSNSAAAAITRNGYSE